MFCGPAVLVWWLVWRLLWQSANDARVHKAPAPKNTSPSKTHAVVAHATLTWAAMQIRCRDITFHAVDQIELQGCSGVQWRCRLILSRSFKTHAVGACAALTWTAMQIRCITSEHCC